MTTSQDRLIAATRNFEQAQTKLAEAQREVDFEASFTRKGTAYLVVRRCIDTGRLESLLAIFDDRTEAVRYARGQKGYGFNKDIFVEDKPFFGVPA